MSVTTWQLKRELDALEQALERAHRKAQARVTPFAAHRTSPGRIADAVASLDDVLLDLRARDAGNAILRARDEARKMLAQRRAAPDRWRWRKAGGVAVRLTSIGTIATLNGIKAGGATSTMVPIAGYLSTFGNVDYGRETVDRGAFLSTIAALRALQGRTSATFVLPMLYSHDMARPIGGWTNISEDATGLFGLGLVDPDTPDGAMVTSMLSKGYVAGISIGYVPIEDYVDASGVRHLQQVDLYEASIVAMPMNPLAVVTRVN